MVSNLLDVEDRLLNFKLIFNRLQGKKIVKVKSTFISNYQFSANYCLLCWWLNVGCCISCNGVILLIYKPQQDWILGSRRALTSQERLTC